MKNLIKSLILVAGISLYSCNQPQPVYVQPVPQVQQQYVDPNQQQPILVNYNGNQILMDYLLYSSLMSQHINPGYYYSTHRYDTHIHISNGHGGFNGYRGHYSTSYHAVSTRSSISHPVSSQRSFQRRTSTAPVRSGGFGRSTSSSSSRSSFGHSSSSSSHSSSGRRR